MNQYGRLKIVTTRNNETRCCYRSCHISGHIFIYQYNVPCFDKIILNFLKFHFSPCNTETKYRDVHRLFGLGVQTATHRIPTVYELTFFLKIYESPQKLRTLDNETTQSLSFIRNLFLLFACLIIFHAFAVVC